MLTSGLDLAAVLLIGLLVAGASATALGSQGTAISGLLGDLVPTSIDGIVVFAAIAGALLITKSLSSLYLTRRTYRFLANRSAIVSSHLADRVLSLPLLDLQRRASQKMTQALTAGANAATVNTLGPLSVILAEASLAVLLVAGLTFVDPLVAAFTVVFFGLVAVILQIAIGRWAVRLGSQLADADIGSMTELQHSMRAYRELVVANRRHLFVKRFGVLRWKSASVLADTFILGQAGKYVFEGALVFGAGGLVAILASTRSLEAAVLALTVFLLVATRIFPSLLRLQGAFTQLRNAEGVSTELFSLVEDLESLHQSPTATAESGEELPRESFDPTVMLSHVTLTYPDTLEPALADVSVTVNAGQSVAIVGTTGAGKSTLADVMLGVIRPTSGTTNVSGYPPEQAVAMWSGAIAYVPQDVAVLSGTVRENVALGFPVDEIQDSDVWVALERAHLADFLHEYRDGLDTIVGENGVKLSGGQRQRLGIARALYTRPRLLVMDEATSALDAQTERDITATIDEISGEVTTIVIAHRLATVRHCELVLYLEGGRLIASGSFDEVRRVVPSFDQQAQLLGLT
jgi:ABC-type multidrug transport system fused ATPase/permease subunit